MVQPVLNSHKGDLEASTAEACYPVCAGDAGDAAFATVIHPDHPSRQGVSPTHACLGPSPAPPALLPLVTLYLLP